MPSKRVPLISCLCFSKDRPLQLEGYIESLRASCPPEALGLSVLHKGSSKAFEDAYEQLGESHPEAEFMKEVDFKSQVKAWLAGVESPFAMFGCDDVVFKQAFDPLTIAKAFNENESLLSFSLRLGVEIAYCAITGCVEPAPELLAKRPYLLWNWRKAEMDWAYPFELDCSVYRREFVEQLLFALDKSSVDWGNPNRLEDFGVRLVKTSLSGCELMASFPSAKAAVPTVNRVQDEYKNFVYDPNSELSSEKLLSLWNEGVRLDVEAYKSPVYHSIHVGDLFLKKGSARYAAASYDERREIILAFARGAGGKAKPFLNHPGLPGFLKSFDEYFHAPGADASLPVQVSPVLDGIEEDSDGKELALECRWALSRALAAKPSKIIDAGSSPLIAGALSCLAPTESLGTKPPPKWMDGLAWREGSPLDTPCSDASVDFISCFSWLETAGLGREGSPLDPEAAFKAIGEFKRVLKPGGHLVGSVAAAGEGFVRFNACRVFAREEILSRLPGFEIAAESFLIDGEPAPKEALESLLRFKQGVWLFDLARKGSPL